MNAGEYRLLLFRRCFRGWNIPVVLASVDGVLTDEAVELLRHAVHPRLVEEIGDVLVSLNELDRTEQEVLTRQADALFAKNSKGVSHAADGVRDYCELTSLTKELGVRADSLPWREAQALRLMLGRRAESERQQMQEMERQAKQPRGRGKR
jgi:D-aminopeptidase